MSDGAVAVVPAAGRSERFGSLKLVAEVEGEPLLDRTLRGLLEAGVERVVVVLAPAVSLGGIVLLADARVRVVVNPDPSRGMFSSIQVGLAVADGSPVLVLPADTPFVRPQTVALVRDACAKSDRVVVPKFGGRRGHPVALPGRLRRALLAADPAGSLKGVLQTTAGPLVELEVDDPGVVRDVDTRADLEGGGRGWRPRS